MGAVGIGGDIGDAVLNRPGAHGAVEGQLVAETSREINTGIGRSRLARELLVLYEVVEGQGLGIDRVGWRGRIRWQGANNGLGQLQLKTEAIGRGCGGASISNNEQGLAQLNPLNHAGIEIDRGSNIRIERGYDLLRLIQQLERHIGIDIGGVIVGRLGLGFGGLGVVLGVVDSGRLAGWCNTNG